MEAKGIAEAPAPELITEMHGVARRANQGDASALPRLRELLAQYPAIWKQYGDIAAQAERSWVVLASGKDLQLRECLVLQAAALREELAGPDPSTVERLLVERIVICWLKVSYFDAMEAQATSEGESLKLALYRGKRQEQAQRMYLTSLAALTSLRKLLRGSTTQTWMKTVPPSRNGAMLPSRNGHSHHDKPPDPSPDFRSRIDGFFAELDNEQHDSPEELVRCRVGIGR